MVANFYNVTRDAPNVTILHVLALTENLGPFMLLYVVFRVPNERVLHVVRDMY